MPTNPIPLVLIPGMMCDHRLYRSQIAELAAEQPLLVVDIACGCTMADIAQHIWSQVSWPYFALAGLSMGGIIAMEMARQQPQKLAGLALLNTTPWAESEHIKSYRQAQIELAQQGHYLRVIEEQIAPYYGDHPASNEAQLALMLTMAEHFGAAVFIKQSLALRDRKDQLETLKHFNKPSLALCGEHDQLCPINHHEAIAEAMPDCQLGILANAGHLTSLQAPQATNSALRAWLKRLN